MRLNIRGATEFVLIPEVNQFSLLDISRKEGTGNRKQGVVIDNLSIIIHFIFDYLRCLLEIEYIEKNRGNMGSIGSVGGEGRG